MKQFLIFIVLTTLLCFNSLAQSQVCSKIETIIAYKGDTLILNATLQSGLTTYQWYKDDVMLSETSGMLTIPDVKVPDAGTYRCLRTCNDCDPLGEDECFEVLVNPQGQFPKNQLIFDFDNMENSAIVRQELMDMGMLPIDSCLCSSLELWEVHPDSLDIEETVKRAKAHVNEEEHASENYYFEIPDPEYCIENEQLRWIPLKDINSTTSDAVLVAVVDNGFSSNSPDILDNIWQNPSIGTDPVVCCDNQELHGYNAVASCETISSRNHGNTVATIISQFMPSNVSIELMNIKVKRKNKRGGVFNFACGLKYAIHSGAAIINISMGYYGKESKLLHNIFEQAKDSSVLIITSAGNGGVINIEHWPSDYSKKGFNNVISVGAVDQFGKKTKFSNDADIYALGHNLFFPNLINNQAFLKSGTSFSTAFVTGAAAAILAENPSYKPLDIKNNLLQENNGWSGEIDSTQSLTIDFEIVENEPVSQPENVDVTTPVFDEQVVDARNKITGSSIIDADSSAIFKAGNQVHLIPGFHAQQGTYFKAIVDDCEETQSTQKQAVIQEAKESNIVALQAALDVYPNPFTSQTNLKIALEKPSFIHLAVKNVLGQHVKTIASGKREKGIYHYSFEANQLPAGVYYAVLSIDGELITKKMVIGR